jgi:transposase
MVDGTRGSHHKEGSTKMDKTSIFAAGIDTGKHRLDVGLHDAAPRLQIDNDAAGHGELAGWLKRHGVKRVGIEASGGYEKAVVRHLRAAGFAVAVFQPAQVRAYAIFRLRWAKNDRIDAALIAACTAALESVREAPDPRFEALAERLTYLEQIEEDLARAKTRREGFREARQQARLGQEVERLKALRKSELIALRRELRRHDDLAQRLDLLQSIPGLGERTALSLVIRMPELGRLSREEAAGLAGLAPFDDDSGQRQGLRRICGGRGRVRRSLFAAALPAAFRWNSQLISFYCRLTAAGKPHKLALIACARKLLIYANTVLARGTPWTQVPTAT